MQQIIPPLNCCLNANNKIQKEVIFINALIIIPAFNEEATIKKVIREIKACTNDMDIIVINDGSMDNTALYAKQENINVISLSSNKGIGAAMKIGYEYALSKKYEYAIQVDADGQHDCIYINSLLIPLIQNSADMVIGSRYIRPTSYPCSLLRRIGIYFFSVLIYYLTGLSIKDATSGFRAVNKAVIECFSRDYPVDYPEVEVIIKLFRQGHRIMEMPVEMRKRQGGRSSITPLRSVYYMLKVSLFSLIDAVKPLNR